MAGFSDYLEAKLLDHVLQGGTIPYAPPSSLWAALHTADPGDDGVGFEFTGMSYVRKQITFNPSTEGPVVNEAAVPWINLPAGQIAWIVIYDADTGGNALFIGQMPEPKIIGAGDSFTVRTGALKLELD